MEYEPIEFEFSDEERKLAADEGYRRHEIDKKIGAKARDGAPEEDKEAVLLDLYGAAGEMAVASYLGLKEFLFLEKVPKRGTFDIPPNIDVKTAMKHRHNLILKVEDDPSFIYVLVTIENKKCILHGWIKGEEGKITTTYKENITRRPSYLVPKGMLYPMAELKKIISLK
jgi:hypothetical protein